MRPEHRRRSHEAFGPPLRAPEEPSVRGPSGKLAPSERFTEDGSLRLQGAASGSAASRRRVPSPPESDADIPPLRPTFGRSARTRGASERASSDHSSLTLAAFFAGAKNATF